MVAGPERGSELRLVDVLNQGRGAEQKPRMRRRARSPVRTAEGLPRETSTEAERFSQSSREGKSFRAPGSHEIFFLSVSQIEGVFER